MIASSYNIRKLESEIENRTQYDLQTLLSLFLQNKGPKMTCLKCETQNSNTTNISEIRPYADICQKLCRAMETTNPGSLEEFSSLFDTRMIVSLVERTTQDCTVLRRCLGQILLYLYAEAPSLRSEILAAIISHLEQLVTDKETDVVLDELLSVLEIIVANRTLTPMKDDVSLVVKTLLSLYKHHALPLWYQRLSNIILVFAKRSQSTVVSMVKILSDCVISANAQSSICIIRTIGALFDTLPRGIFSLDCIVSTVMITLRAFLQPPVASRGIVFETFINILHSTQLAEGILALPTRYFAVFISLLRNAISLQWDESLRSAAKAVGTCIVENYRARFPHALGHKFKEFVEHSKYYNKEKNARFDLFWKSLGECNNVPK